ncbi:MAG: TolC family protein [Bacteroidota bacterium]|nr:TolC family protein [Bacteroidota bacterium]MDP4218011.1 TolC family protein [Bacteroidota bacterium]MDP4247194.1 TolC family protein [Bacteroidota bacterium]MDP4254797.1 TolC family protein [Bacteroidota bacterium]MDP4258198.1 TolC family protein [Bacteroidota bacterium]
MSMRIIVCSLILFSLNSRKACRAQDSAALPVKWDLQTCLDYAKKNNIQINTLRLTEKNTEQEYELSKAATLPNLTGSLNHTYTHSKNVNPVVGGFQTQSSFAGNYSLNSTVTLYHGGYYMNDIRQKNLEIESANLNILQSENDITLQITQAYLNILLAKENIIYIHDLLATTQAQVDQGQKQYDAGSIARNALIELQAQLANDKYTLVTAQNTERQNKLTLKQILQLPTSTAFDIVKPDTVIATEAVASLDTVESAALRTRPEIKNGLLGIEIARYDLLKARSGYLPSLTASGTLSSGYSNNLKDAYFKQLDDNFFQQIGLGLSIPIFTRRVVRTNVELAKIEMEQAALNLKGTKTALAQEIEQAYINVENAQAQYDAAVEELNATRESFRIAGEELKVGAVNTVNYLQQKTLYTQAFQAYIQAKYNSALSVKIYDFYMGIAVKL